MTYLRRALTWLGGLVGLAALTIAAILIARRRSGETGEDLATDLADDNARRARDQAAAATAAAEASATAYVTEADRKADEEVGRVDGFADYARSRR